MKKLKGMPALANCALRDIPGQAYASNVELVTIYDCLCDLTRLRLLNVLTHQPLCVCHFQAVLREPQVKISKHLAYLRSRGLVSCERNGSWMIYALPDKLSRELRANLACLQDCAQENPLFRRDLARLKQLASKLAASDFCNARSVPRASRRLSL